ncbi:PREDICTED: uncharacterized protein LOC106119717 isoform X5 [Papilio xuthus]|uniref:Uncharacterized protein LOC106119717 isoform X5 n=1 Tax=Papilio xuthus TaxID=66420 RepID=A0AAJ6ZDQ2_PAPXU|nr:PREDICTED: uncharacterized protein LOC106119717 isoform X5 [Papilio xuthus]
MLPRVTSKTKVLQNKRISEEKKTDKSSRNILKLKGKHKKELPVLCTSLCDCTSLHLSRIVIGYRPKKRQRIISNRVSWDIEANERIKFPNVQVKRKVTKKGKSVAFESDEFFHNLENHLKALNLGKTTKSKTKVETPASERSKGDKDSNDSNEAGNTEDTGPGVVSVEVRRRGKRRRKARGAGSDRLASAGLAAQAQQDPETQIAGIGTDSHNASSRGSIATAEDVPLPLVVKPTPTSTTDSFLDDDILKYLHREVDEEAIETEFDTKRRYVLKEALRTRGSRPAGAELQSVARAMPASCSLADWLHVPRVFSRTNATFALPIDYTALETLSPMSYAARFVTIKKSKQLLYLTVLRKFRPNGYMMPIKNIEEGLILMMGGIMNIEQADQYKSIMEWDSYEEENNFPDEIKLNLLDEKYKEQFASEAADLEDYSNTLKYRTWCGLCAICERMYGRYPPREKDPPDGIELSDFTMIETKLATLKVHSGLMEVLNAIRIR